MVGEQGEANQPQPQDPDQSTTIRVESEGRADEVRLGAINHLFFDISRYNSQFSMGAMMSRSLLSFIRFEDETGDDEPAGSAVNLAGEEEYQQMTASALDVIHRDTLDKIGLSLEPVAKGATLMAMGEEASTGQMRVNIADKNRFTSFLGALEPEQIEQTGLKVNLESLSGVLAQQVLDNYDLQQPSDEALQLFGSLSTIVDQYHRLGMEEAVGQLETYLQHARQGDLREYIAVEQTRLFQEPGKGFGPADWQTDSSPEFLENRWNEALTILMMAKDNPKAQALYVRLRDHLVECAKLARNDSKSLEESYTPEVRAELRKILDATNNRLEDITSS